MPSTVTVHYPFHPLHNHCLQVIARPRKTHGAVTVQCPDGHSLKIPLWMLQPEAADFRIDEQITFSAATLLALVDVVHTGSMVVTTNPPQEHTDATSHTESPRRERSTPPAAGTRRGTAAHCADGAMPSCRRTTLIRQLRRKNTAKSIGYQFSVFTTRIFLNS